jgi:uncharacterized damage-inducible protein DinB
MFRSILTLLLLAAIPPSALHAQHPETNHQAPDHHAEAAFRDEILGHFESSMRKVAALAEAMPEDLYEWSPGEGVMEVGQVYMHIARYNFLYPETSLGVATPADIDLDTLESIRDKATVERILQRSAEHVRSHLSAMSGPEVGESTVLYGRQVAKWAVMMQLVAHMNEHLGQSIAYARMNRVTPPWSG